MEAALTRLLQLRHPAHGRRIALIEGETLLLLSAVDSIYRLAQMAHARRQTLLEAAAAARSSERLDYDPIYDGKSDWRLLPPFDHPDEPARCLVTGTGLTHKASAQNRQAMHTNVAAPITDSLRMYQLGL